MKAPARCPNCGKPTPEGAAICPACDFILDTSFLGSGILDDDAHRRRGEGAPATPAGKPKGGPNLMQALMEALGPVDGSELVLRTVPTRTMENPAPPVGDDGEEHATRTMMLEISDKRLAAGLVRCVEVLGVEAAAVLVRDALSRGFGLGMVSARKYGEVPLVVWHDLDPDAPPYLYSVKQTRALLLDVTLAGLGTLLKEHKVALDKVDVILQLANAASGVNVLGTRDAVPRLEPARQKAVGDLLQKHWQAPKVGKDGLEFLYNDPLDGTLARARIGKDYKVTTERVGKGWLPSDELLDD
ncbi:MAG: hypothetical protein AB2A00_08595 [Myxococcota bacterium]